MSEEHTEDDRSERLNMGESRSEVAVTSNYKVLGELTDKDGVGVLGQNNASNGTPIAVKGAVPNNADGYGLETPDNAKVGGDLEVEGAVSSGGTYVEAYVDSNISVTGSFTDKTVTFDNELADVNGEYDPSSGVFTAAQGGLYSVTAQTRWEANELDDGDRIVMELQTSAGTINNLYTTYVVERDPPILYRYVSVSKPMPASQGDTIKVVVSTDSNNGSQLNGDSTGSKLSIVKIR